jgi:oxalate decarboxylase/phosphoglucose isomerase-like protein (cupin superfamily)
VSVSLFGRYRIEELQKGDVGYIPKGDGHSIENVGSGAARSLIGFNAGIYETIDLSQWDCGKSQGRVRHEFWPAGGGVRNIPGSRRVYRRQGWSQCIKTSTELVAQACPGRVSPI